MKRIAHYLFTLALMGTITLENGSYEINNVPPGTYTLKASFLGYKEKSISITVRDGQVTNQDMELAFTTIIVGKDKYVASYDRLL